MQTKKYLISTLMASSLLVGAMIATPGGALGKSLEPKGSWSLSKVDRTAQGGNSYCTLSRKYEGGIILSLARNTAEEYSLALDFQKDVFAKDEPLKINLQPGPGKLRAYDLLPASQKAVVIRLGWDEGFFEALNTSQKMSVKIADSEYDFAMPLIARGQADLEDCMEDLKSAERPGPATVVPGKDVLSAAPVSTSKAFDAGRVNQAEMAMAKADVEAQEQQVLQNFAASMQAQEDAVDNKKTNFGRQPEGGNKPAKMANAAPVDITPKAEMVQQIEPAAGKSGDAPQDGGRVAALEEEIAALNAEKAHLASRLASIKPEDPARFAALEGELGAARAEIEVLKKSASAAAESSEKMGMLQKQLDNVVAENTALKEAAKQGAELTGKTAALEKRVADLSMENAALIAKAGGVEQTAAQIAEMQKQIAALSAENEAFKSKAAEPEKSLPADVAKITQLEKQLADIKAQNAEQASKLAAAPASLPADTAKIAELQKQLSAMQTENADIKARIAMPTVLTSLPDDAARIADLEKQMAALKTENADVKAKLAAAPAAGAAQPNDAKIVELEKRIADLTTENNSLKLASATGGDVSKAKLLELETKNKTLQDRLDAVALQNAQKPDAAQVAGLQNKINELTIKNQQLEETVRNSQTRIAEAAINTETKSLKTIADLEVKLAAAQKDNIALSQEVESLKSGQDQARLTLASGNWDLEQATKRYNESERENRRLGLALEQARMSCNAEKSKIEQMLFDPAVADQKQIDRLTQLEEQLAEANAKLASAGISAVGNGGGVAAVPVAAVSRAPLDAPSSGWQDEKAQLLARIAALESDDKFTGISPLPDSGAERDAKVQAAESQNAQLRGEIEKLRAQLADANSNGSIRADRVAMAQREAERLKREKEFAANQSLTYQNQIMALQQENNRLKAEGGNAPTPPPAKDNRAAAQARELAAVQPAAGVPDAPSKGNFGSSEVKALLQKAGVTSGGLNKSSSGFAGAENFTWSGQNGVRGVASVKQIGSESEFSKMVDQYIAGQKSSCGGDFASMPSPSSSAKGKVALYETACVSGSQGTSASTVFFIEQGRFVAISSETAAADMDNAMDSRDRIVSALAGM